MAIPGKETTTGTFPTNVVLEKDRLGGEDLGAVGTDAPGLGIVDGVGRFAAGRSSATVSWRSCAHCPPLASALEDLNHVSKKEQKKKKKDVGNGMEYSIPTRAAIYDQAVGARLALESVTVVGGSLVMNEKAAASGDEGWVLLSFLHILFILAALSGS